MREAKTLTPIVEKFREYKKANSDLTEAKEMLADSSLDKEFRDMASEEAFCTPPDLTRPRGRTGRNLFFRVCPRFPVIYQTSPFSSLMTFLIFFSILMRGTITSRPQPQHLRRKSIPERSTANSFEPHGCFFFIISLSPTCTSKFLTPFLNHVSKHYNTTSP